MATKKTTKDETEAVEITPTYDYLALRTNAKKLFGVSTALFDGATFKLDKSAKYTIDEIKKLISDASKQSLISKKK